MGRHSNGTRNYRIASWMWLALLALLLIIAVVIGWGALRSSNTAANDQAQCPEGDYQLKVWSAQERESTANELVERYNEAHHVVNDHCVQAEVSTVPDETALEQIKKSEDVAGAWIPADAAAAAKQLENAAAKPVGDEAAVVKDSVLFTLGNGAGIAEQTTRSAKDFSAFTADAEGASVVPLAEVAAGSVNGAGSTSAGESSGNTDGVNAADDAQDPAKNADTGQNAAAQDVTFVLDASGSMGLYEGNQTRLDNLRGPLGETMRAVGANGGSVGLWNYSSPMNAGVNNAFRNNVDISADDDGTQAAGVLNQLSFGGATYTYESVLAAYRAAVENAKATGTSNSRVVLITDGPNDGGNASLDAAIAEIKRLHGELPVGLEIVTIGANVNNGELDQLAAAGGGSVHSAADSLNVAEPLRAATAG